MLSLRDTFPEGVLDLLGKEMWDTPYKEFVAGQGWLRERLDDVYWTVKSFAPFHPW